MEVEYWLVSFSTYKIKPLSFSHHQNSPDLSFILLYGTQLKEIDCFDKILGLHLTPDLKLSTWSVENGAVKMVRLFYHSKKYLVLNVTLLTFFPWMHIFRHNNAFAGVSESMWVCMNIGVAYMYEYACGCEHR